MRAHWTARSLQRLQQIHDHIALDQPLNPNRFVDRLTRRAQTIALQPRAGRIVPEYQSTRGTTRGRVQLGLPSRHVDHWKAADAARIVWWVAGG